MNVHTWLRNIVLDDVCSLILALYQSSKTVFRVLKILILFNLGIETIFMWSSICVELYTKNVIPYKFAINSNKFRSMHINNIHKSQKTIMQNMKLAQKNFLFSTNMYWKVRLNENCIQDNIFLGKRIEMRFFSFLGFDCKPFMTLSNATNIIMHILYTHL